MKARILCFVIALAALIIPWADAQSKDKAAAELEKKKFTLVIEQSQRHLEYGLELRKQGMTTQAAAEIILAYEIGQGNNPGASNVFYVMRQYDAAFWKRFGSRASPGKVEAYDKKARALLASDDKESLDVANWAGAHGFDHDADAIYVELLIRQGAALAFDSKGQITLPAGTIPKEASARLREAAVTINGKLYARDELLSKLPSLKEIVEVSSDDLLVRTTTTIEDARDLHALCTQLLPVLAADLGAKTQRRLELFVFAKREDFEKTLDALDLGAHKIMSGVAMPSPLVAMVCAEELEPDILRGVCLHETTHLFCYAVSYSVFPRWYAEGYADTFGGTETFTWDGAKLTTQGLLARSRIDELKVEGGMMPLSELLVADQLAQWRKSKEAGLAFSAESWAFLRYLRTGAGAEIAARFDQWEERCCGQALGFELGAKRPSKSGPASDLFNELFGKDLAKIEAGFKTWVRDL